MSAQTRRLAVIVASVLAVVACTGTDGSADPDSGGSAGAAAAVVTDSKEALLGVLGPPDAFTTKVVAVGDAEVPVDSFVYAELGRSYEMVDGVVVGEEEVEAFPDGTMLPLHLGYYDVRTGMTETEVRQSLEGYELTSIDAAALDMPAEATLLAAGQILIGLIDDRVVYIQTYPLVPDADGAFQDYLEGGQP
jgi:hypothetical protein